MALSFTERPRTGLAAFVPREHCGSSQQSARQRRSGAEDGWKKESDLPTCRLGFSVTKPVPSRESRDDGYTEHTQ